MKITLDLDLDNLTISNLPEVKSVIGTKDIEKLQLLATAVSRSYQSSTSSQSTKNGTKWLLTLVLELSTLSNEKGVATLRNLRLRESV